MAESNNDAEHPQAPVAFDEENPRIAAILRAREKAQEEREAAKAAQRAELIAAVREAGGTESVDIAAEEAAAAVRQTSGMVDRGHMRSPQIRTPAIARLLNADLTTDEGAQAFARQRGALPYHPSADELRAVQVLLRELDDVITAGTPLGWGYAAALAREFITKDIELVRIVGTIQQAVEALDRACRHHSKRQEIDAKRQARLDGAREQSTQRDYEQMRVSIVETVRTNLAAVRQEYMSLTTEYVLAQLDRVDLKKAAKGGSGNVQVPHIAAELSVECHAFGYGAKTARSVALEDAKNAFLVARGRAWGQKRQRKA